MRIVLLVGLLLAGCQTVGPLVPLKASPHNKCAADGCMYDEWQLSAAPQIRFVISGYEDGTDRDFYRVEADGTYTLLLEIHPIIKDGKGTFWWGYAWSIKGLPYERHQGQVKVWATFEHDQCDDGNHSHPKWQHRVPVVLFEGEKVRWNVEQPAYEYRLVSLEDLVLEAAKANKALQPTPSRCALGRG